MQLDFLDFIFDNLEGYIEIREIDTKGINKKWLKTKDDIKNYTPPKERNVYFGCYERNSRRNGKASNCINSNIIWLDFDKIKDNETLEEIHYRATESIERAKLPPYTMKVCSGNGYHFYWKLREATKESEKLLKQLAEITGADTKATDKARIMRLPGTQNVKDLSNIKKCELLEVHQENIYDVSIFENISKTKANQEEKQATEKKGFIDLIDEDIDRECIKNMLKGVKKGYRKFSLGRLIKHFQQKGYIKKNTLELMQEWNKRNNPKLREEDLKGTFYKYWSTDYMLLGCKISDNSIQEKLDKFCFSDVCKFQKNLPTKIDLKNSSKIDNRIVDKFREDTITGNLLLVLGIINTYDTGLSLEQLKKDLISPASKKICMDERNLNKILEKLVSLKYIKKIKDGRTYLICQIPQGTFGKGFTIISNGSMNGLIDKRVTPSQFKLYVLLLSYSYGKKKVYPSRNTIAKDLGIKHNEVISIQIKALEEARYLRIGKYTNTKNNQKNNHYYLLV